ncbi:MAG: family 10 glycosylhydrolase [Bacteroidota bacterium]
MSPTRSANARRQFGMMDLLASSSIFLIVSPLSGRSWACRLRIAGVLLFLALVFPVSAQAQDIPPKRELRAVWVATLANLDWPSSASLSPYRQQREFIHLLEKMQRVGMNAVMVQVRPAGDAFYPSALAPWSQYLTGKQGRPPEPFYDPLEFMIRECHARNIEFHAWFNPFRALSHKRLSSVAASNLLNFHADWFFTYGDSKYFDPGHPAARAHILKVILEVVRKYDVDGVHLDDYFYPYPRAGESLPDARNWRVYGGEFSDKAEWRRSNVDAFISTLSDSIFLEKQWVKFGVSPFGVWRNQDQDPRGSATIRALSGYDELYADARKWLELGWVDYLAPQLYWSIASRRASYRGLLNWWTQVPRDDHHLYIGHAAYLLQQTTSPKWASASEFIDQVDLCRNSSALGDIWFRASTFMANASRICDRLQDGFYRYPALPPEMPWLDSIPPNRPRSFDAYPTEDGVFLQWRQPTPAHDLDVARYYLVYRFQGVEEPDFEDPRHIIGIVNEPEFTDLSAERGQRYLYAVTAVDRLHNESDRYVFQWVELGE